MVSLRKLLLCGDQSALSRLAQHCAAAGFTAELAQSPAAISAALTDSKLAAVIADEAAFVDFVLHAADIIHRERPDVEVLLLTRDASFLDHLPRAADGLVLRSEDPQETAQLINFNLNRCCSRKARLRKERDSALAAVGD